MTDNKDPLSNASDESISGDDAIIGKVFWRSLGIGAVIAIVVAGLYFVFKPPPEERPEHVSDLAVPVAHASHAAEIPHVRFTDVTAASGIDFVHHNGAYGDKLLPETMGGGVAFFDFDADEDPDLLFVNSTYWPGHVPEGKRPTTCALYENDGTGRFHNVTAGSGLDLSLYGMGVAVGDYDNDGLEDVYLTAVGPNHLLHNLGHGRFRDVTKTAGVAGGDRDWSTAATWFDEDNDGDLDLFVTQYVQWSPALDLELGTTLIGIGRAYGQPTNFKGSLPRLFRNEGNGTFRDVSADAGVQVRNAVTGEPAAKSLGVAPIDLNSDGWMDLVVGNDTVRNYVLSNRWDGTFQEIGALTGIAFDSYGKARGAMGIDAARLRDDGAIAIGIANFANEMTALYVAQNNPMIFTDEAITAGIGPPSRLPLKFGLFFFDFDLDGWLDLLTADGHLEEEISKIQQSQTYRQPAQLFWNAGPRGGFRFLEVKEVQSGPDLFKPMVGRGSAFADIDGDGDLDVVLTQVNGPPRLLRNDQALDHRWVRVRLVGVKSNRDAIGAWLRLRVNGTALWRQVMPTRSYLSQSERVLTIGLGRSGTVERAEVIWPGGRIQPVAGLKRDALNVIEEAP